MKMKCGDDYRIQERVQGAGCFVQSVHLYEGRLIAVQDISLKEAADALQMSVSTLRRWCDQLEAAGYSFEQSVGGRRRLQAGDIGKLKELQLLQDKDKVPLEEACEMLVIRAVPNETVIDVSAFEQALLLFPKTLYWDGREAAYASLLKEWEQLKKRLGQTESLLEVQQR
ncbi:hypothetical protein HUB94_20310 (plasmid) [Paenibacillus cellulosilyticus]|nr:hypothetical protein HUB94_20310 [Paenibacillus cellulosilyticus]